MDHDDDVREGGPWRAWALALGVVTLLALAYSTENYVGQRINLAFAARMGQEVPPPVPWIFWVLREIPVWYSWLALSPAILRVSRRFPVLGPRRLRNLGVHLGAGTVAVVLNVMVVSAVQQYVPPAAPVEVPYLQRVAIGLAGYGFFLLSVYCAIVAVQHAALYYRAFQTRALHAAQLETRLAHARMDVLKMQLQPHFLFNTLNTIASLMKHDVPAAHGTLVRLSGLLRRSLDGGSGHETPLRDELDFVEQYIEIQRARFRDRLHVEVDAEPATLELLVPRLVLQPLVENAIRHGVQEQEGPGRIVVRARRADGWLRLEVVDNGPGLAPAARGALRPEGIGLANTRARLGQLYGARYRFVLENAEAGGVRVVVEIPARAAEPLAEFVEV